MTKTSFSRIRILLVLIIALLLSSYLIFMGISIWSDYELVEDNAKRTAQSLVSALDEHAARTFGEADQILLNVIDAINTKGGIYSFNEQTLHELLLLKRQQAPQIGELFVVNSSGLVLANSYTYPIGQLNVSEREYFIHFRDHPNSDPFISRPLQTAIFKLWRVVLARGIKDSGGKFQGVVAIGIVSDYFNKFYSSINVGAGGFVDLVRKDGYSLIHEPFSEVYTTVNFSKYALFSKNLPYSPSGTYFSQSPITFKTYLRSYRTVIGFPLVAVISLSKNDVFARWYIRVWRQGLSAVLLLTLVSILSIILFKHITKLEIAEEERDKLISELQEALAQVKTLKGLLPICAHCKKVRDDEGYWQQIEKYIRDRSEAEFSHGICPECAKKYYPEFVNEAD